ncbi:MAG: hypothetical protein CM15mV148_310 [uncultured marine virus]|nr:MAG: hypothetical protein CM15mV148_310 [uncultured marine virus]
MRIHHSPVMGTAEVNGKTVNVEVIEGGTYKLEIPDGPTYYASSVKVRPYHATLYVQALRTRRW